MPAVSLTPNFIKNGNVDPVDNSLKRSLPSVSLPLMPSPTLKRPAVSAHHPIPCCAALAGLIAVAAVVNPIAGGVDALVLLPPRVVRPSPVSVFDHVLSAAAPSQLEKAKQKGSQTGGTTMIGHVTENEFAPFAREDYFNNKVVYDGATIEKKR